MFDKLDYRLFEYVHVTVSGKTGLIASGAYPGRFPGSSENPFGVLTLICNGTVSKFSYWKHSLDISRILEKREQDGSEKQEQKTPDKGHHVNNTGWTLHHNLSLQHCW